MEVDLNLSIVSDEEIDFYNESNGKPVHTNIDDELQLLPKENKLTSDQGIQKAKNEILEPSISVRSSNKLPFAKQTEKLSGVPYHTKNNKTKLTDNGISYWKRHQQQWRKERRESLHSPSRK